MQVQAGCAHFSVPAISHLLERFSLVQQQRPLVQPK
jgi:acid stress-induced BolA-like protein IbaG/YrbA